MNGFDIAIFLVLALAALGGFRQGFILQVATILGAVAALGIARLEYPDVRTSLEHHLPHSPWVTVIAYVAVFLLVWAAVVILARKIRSLARLMMLGWMDRVGGAIVGLIEGALVVELLLYLARRAPHHGLRSLAAHSALAPTFLHFSPTLNHLFPHVPH